MEVYRACEQSVGLVCMSTIDSPWLCFGSRRTNTWRQECANDGYLQ